MREGAGIRLHKWQNLVCVGMIAILPESLMADDSAAAILHSTGGVRLNGNPAPPSSALFPDDLVQTPSHSEATINAAGSTVMVISDTVVQFEGSELHLDHGTLQVSTSRQLRVRVGCLTVVPVNPAWTQYDVTDVDGRVTVAARSSDVNIEARGSALGYCAGRRAANPRRKLRGCTPGASLCGRERRNPEFTMGEMASRRCDRGSGLLGAVPW